MLPKLLFASERPCYEIGEGTVGEVAGAGIAFDESFCEDRDDLGDKWE